MGRFNTEDEINFAIEEIVSAVKKLRKSAGVVYN